MTIFIRAYFLLLICFNLPFTFATTGQDSKSDPLECMRILEAKAKEISEDESKAVFLQFSDFFDRLPVSIQQQVFAFGPGAFNENGEFIHGFLIHIKPDSTGEIAFTIDESVEVPTLQEEKVLLPKKLGSYTVLIKKL